MTEQVTDCEGTVLKVGDTVIVGDMEENADDFIATVTEITESDADYDDELQRGVQYPPKVRVVYDNGDRDEFSSHDTTKWSWALYPDGPDPQLFMCDDIQKREA